MRTAVAKGDRDRVAAVITREPAPPGQREMSNEPAVTKWQSFRRSNMTVVSRRQALGAIGATALYAVAPLRASAQTPRMQSWPLKTPERTGIHDVAPAPDGGVWFTAQASGHLGYFDPATGHSELIALGSNSAPHGVIQGP